MQLYNFARKRCQPLYRYMGLMHCRWWLRPPRRPLQRQFHHRHSQAGSVLQLLPAAVVAQLLPAAVVAQLLPALQRLLLKLLKKLLQKNSKRWSRSSRTRREGGMAKLAAPGNNGHKSVEDGAKSAAGSRAGGTKPSSSRTTATSTIAGMRDLRTGASKAWRRDPKGKAPTGESHPEKKSACLRGSTSFMLIYACSGSNRCHWSGSNRCRWSGSNRCHWSGSNRCDWSGSNRCH